ncbi:MAG: spermidine synthase [Acidobacteriota bacterium]
MAWALVAVGTLSLLGQVVLLREVLVAAFGVEFFALAGLAFWLAGAGAGAAWGCRPSAPSKGGLALPFLALGLTLPLGVAAARLLRPLAVPLPGLLPAPGKVLLGSALLLLPPAFLSGLLFRRAAGPSGPAGAFARAYAWEGLGAVAGGLLAAAFTFGGLPNFTAALAVAALCGLSALAASPRASVRGLSLGLAASALAALPLSKAADRALTARSHPYLAATAETPYGRITVEVPQGQTVVFWNDALAWESQGAEAEARIVPAALQVADPRTALLLGGAAEGLLPEVLAQGFARVDVVEMDRRLLDALRPLLPRESRRAFASPRVRLLYADPVAFLTRTDRRYAFIFSAAPPPLSLETGRLWTVEFFRRARSRLAPRGVFATSLPTPENLWTPLERRLLASLFDAMREAFPHVLLLPGPQTLLVGSASPLVLDPTLLAERQEARPARPRLAGPPYLRYLLTNDRFRTLPSLLEAEGAGANRARRPSAVPLAVLAHLSRSHPRLATAPWHLPGPPGPGALAGAALFLLALGTLSALAQKRFPGLSAAWLAWLWGFSGMVGQTAVLLHHVVVEGALYRDVGLLLGLFMAGLAAGSAAGGRRAAARGAAPLEGLLLFAGLALLFHSGGGGLLLSSLLETAAGFVAGLGFAGAVAAGGEGRGPALYAADLCGGALGALAGSLFLLPLWGLSSTAVLLAALSLSALPVLSRSAGRGRMAPLLG